MSREGSTRFSFLLFIPAVAGATIVELPSALAAGTSGVRRRHVVVGMSSSALSASALSGC